jgi:DNA repair exonuclease SbcCD ATPase subunit
MAHERREGENHAVANPLAEMFQRQKEEIARLTSELESERKEHHLTLDAAEKAAGHIETQTAAIRFASDEIARLQEKLEAVKGERHKTNVCLAAILMLCGSVSTEHDYQLEDVLRAVEGIRKERDQQRSEIQRLTALFDADPEQEAALTVNILRKWDREKLVRFAMHLLGDSFEQGFYEAVKARDERIAQLEAELERALKPVKWCPGCFGDGYFIDSTEGGPVKCDCIGSIKGEYDRFQNELAALKEKG